MAWRFSVYLLPMFLSGAVACLLAAYAWRRRAQRAAIPFAVMMIGLAVWSFGYGIELGFDHLAPMLLLDQLAFVGSVTVPTAWFLLAATYAGYDEWLTRRTVALLSVEPVATLLLVWTNGAHRLIWRSTSLDVGSPLVTPHLVFGPAYWANYTYSFVVIVVGIALVGSVLVRGSRIYRRQSLVMLAGLVVPLGANIAFNVVPGANPVPTLDLTPAAFGVMGIFYALALFRFRMLDLAPTARETLVEAMDDGIVVTDAADVVVDANPAARRALGEPLVGRPIQESPLGPTDDLDDGPLELSVDDRLRTYELSSTALSDFRGDDVGQFVLMRDVTELAVLRAHEQRLSVLNRVLRHNLRNELNVIVGESEVVAEAVDDAHQDSLAAIEAAADRMLDISEKARHVESTIGRSASETVDVVDVVETVAHQLSADNPDATVTIESPTHAWAATVGGRQLAVAVENLGENALEHNPSAAPTVRFRVEDAPETVSITVADDGPGIPEMELSAIDRDVETPLAHGSGLGLWLVRWVVEASDGDLRIDDREGTEVTIELDAQSPPDRRGAPGA